MTGDWNHKPKVLMLEGTHDEYYYLDKITYKTKKKQFIYLN